jgi:hypothetical protein
MRMAEIRSARTTEYTGNDRELSGIVLAVLTFWLFAQTTLNLIPDMQWALAINSRGAAAADRQRGPHQQRPIGESAGSTRRGTTMPSPPAG